MSTEIIEQPERWFIYRHISQVADAVESIDKALIPIDQLHSLGFYPVQVGFREACLTFAPCFFIPMNAESFDKRQIIFPSLESFYSTRPCDKNAAPGKIMDMTKRMYKHIQQFAWEWDWDEEIYDVTHSGEVVQAVHLGPPLRGSNLLKRNSELELQQSLPAGSWKSMLEFEHGRIPNMLSCIIHDVSATDNTFAIGEVRAITRALRLRYEDPYIERFTIVPLLILSFLGPHHGRILQVHHNGERIVVQYSPLMNFEVAFKEDTPAPTALFARYFLCRTKTPWYFSRQAI